MAENIHDLARWRERGEGSAAIAIVRRKEKEAGAAGLVQWCVLALGAMPLAQDKMVRAGMSAKALVAWSEGWTEVITKFLLAESRG